MCASRLNRATALTIAGSDPSGGAGIQADLKTFTALEVYGLSAITAVIAQNCSKVFRVAPTSPSIVAAQIEAVAIERKPNAIKIGALGTASIVRAVATSLVAHKLAAPVVDPVLISSSGSRLLSRAGERALIEHILPRARVITPNVPEAQMLTGIEIKSPTASHEHGGQFVRMGARAVVIKGGHFDATHDAIDLLYDGHSFVSLK